MILLYIGFLFTGAGCTVLLPLLSCAAFPADRIYADWYVIPGTAAVCIGYLITTIAHQKLQTDPGAPYRRLKKHQDSAVVLAGWFIAITVNTLPFILSGQYTVTQAVFETVSGWTTTGLSIVNVETAPHILLLHRSIMLFFGGIGVILSALFFLGGNGSLKLYTAEGHGDMLAPDVVKSSRYIVYIYTAYIAGGAVLYRIAGMNWFDALNHSIAALSTGGFSTHSASIGYYHSTKIESVTIILMILGSTNFLAHLYMLTGKWKNIFLYCETRAAAVILAFAIPIVSFSIYRTCIPQNIPESIRTAVFQTVSALTTTGFQTVASFNAWPPLSLLVILLLMLIGGGSGSTAGGIKLYRIYTAAKDIQWTLRDSFAGQLIVQPHHIHNQNRILSVDSRNRRAVLSFISLYMICFWTGIGILAAYGYPISKCMFEMASALGTVGLSSGIMSAEAPLPVLWTGSIAMFLGRVEITLAVFGILRIFKDISKTGRQ
jgi:trk system potassium uptake protein TrkH